MDLIIKMFRTMISKSSALIAPTRSQVRSIRMCRRTRPAPEHKNHILSAIQSGNTQNNKKDGQSQSEEPTMLDKCKRMYNLVVDSNEYNIAREYSIKAKNVAYPVAQKVGLQLSQYVCTYSQMMYDKLLPIFLRIYMQIMSTCSNIMSKIGKKTKKDDEEKKNLPK